MLSNTGKQKQLIKENKTTDITVNGKQQTVG